MIRYALVCDRRHEFESWFTNSQAYDAQVRQGLVTCPLCGSAEVEKALMKPQLARTERTRSSPPEPSVPKDAPAPPPMAVMTAQEQALRRKLRELRDHLVKNAENVGSRFPEEARKMHYGETDHRSIYGVATAQDAEALSEEGIAFSALPVLPDDRN
jgi:hypothetical protein